MHEIVGNKSRLWFPLAAKVDQSQIYCLIGVKLSGLFAAASWEAVGLWGSLEMDACFFRLK